MSSASFSPPHAASGLTYRPDIDGLRAIAVLSVVIYHAVPGAMPGGYVGVDVFFVISGYLITKLIAADIERNRFSIASFYVRRTKRIFPALFVVLLTTLVLGFILLTPAELAQLGRTTAATAAFVSNFAFWQDTGYFDTAAETKPLLHTWSLAVEEQFYVLWPLALLLIYRRPLARVWLTVSIAASFAVSVYMTARHQPTAFFLLPPRAWELLVGAVLALGMVPRPSGHSWRTPAALVGLTSIVSATLLFDSSSAFPGWSALLPVLGTALVISAGDGGGNAVARHLLARRAMVFVGLISYSLYLWHWPLLSLARVTQRGHLSVPVALAIVLVATVLSALTWRFVETPLRARGITPAAAPVLTRYALVSVIALLAGLYVHASDGFRASASPELQRIEFARFDVNPLSGPCLRWQSVTGPLPGIECITGDAASDRRMVLWGDSHADAVAPGFVPLAVERGYALHQLTMAGCPPLVAAEVEGRGANYAPCTAFNGQVLEYVSTDPAVDVVVLSARWTLYTENERFGNDPGPISYLVDGDDREWSPAASKRVFARALHATVTALRAAGRDVILLGTIPPLGVNVPDCLARNHRPLSGIVSCDADAAVVRAHVAFADGQVQRVAAAHSGVCTNLPVRAVCGGERCLSTLGDDILYANDDHLSVSGAAFVARHFAFEPCLAVRRASRADEAAPGPE
jgi:peptidoglycan/LPS O-acetylase OafA/YrhL